MPIEDGTMTKVIPTLTLSNEKELVAVAVVGEEEKNRREM